MAPEPGAADLAPCAAGVGLDPVIFAIRRSPSAAISEPSRYLLQLAPRLRPAMGNGDRSAARPGPARQAVVGLPVVVATYWNRVLQRWVGCVIGAVAAMVGHGP